MKTYCIVLSIACLGLVSLQAQAPSASPSAALNPVQAQRISTYQGYISTLTNQIAQTKFEVEKQRSNELDAKAKGLTVYMNQYAAAVKKNQNILALQQAALTMYKQQLTLEEKPLSTFPMVAAIEEEVKQLTLEKGQLNLAKLAATRSGGKPDPRLDAQVKQKDARLIAKKQELKMELLRVKTPGR